MWNMFAFVKVLPGLQPSPAVLRKILLVLFIAAVGTGGFFWGRSMASQTTRPGKGGGEPFAGLTNVSDPNAPRNDSVVAYIWGKIPITRQELGEYLIERQGAQRIDALVNRRIIELVCREKGIFVSDAEVEMQYKDDIQALSVNKVNEQDFIVHILKHFNKSVFEWKEDVIRPRIAMNKLVRSEITVSSDEIEKAYEAAYGPKVECRMIVMPANQPALWHQVHKKVKNSEAAFNDLARDKDIQIIEVLRVNGGKAPAIHRNFGDRNVESVAFGLKPGEVSDPVEMQDHTAVIMKCDRQIPEQLGRPDLNERVRTELYQNVLKMKITQRIPEKLKELRRYADPVILLDGQRAKARPQAQTASLKIPEHKGEPLVPPPSSVLNVSATSPAPPLPPLPPGQGNQQILADKDLVPPPAKAMETETPRSSNPFGPSLPFAPPVSVNPLTPPSLSPSSNPPPSSPSVLPVPLPSLNKE